MAPIELPRAANNPLEFSIIGQEKITPSGFYKYQVRLPLPSLDKYIPTNSPPTPIPLDSVSLTVWAKNKIEATNLDELRQLISGNTPEKYVPIMLLNGLMSNSEQFDRTNTSFIQKLTNASRIEGSEFNPIFIGMSGPGFTGSEVNKLPKYGPLDVGVRRYSSIVASAVDELRFPQHGALIGHSAGGAVVHQFQLDHPNNLLKVSLCPAIHIKKAPQFETIRALLGVQSAVIGLSRILCMWSSDKVVRYLLGLPLIGKLGASSQAQVDMHVAELDIHRLATITKLVELNMPLKQDENIISSTLTLIAENDRLTPPKQIKKGFPDDFTGFIHIPKAHHDDIFMKESTQNMVIPFIARYLLTKQIDAKYAQRLGMTIH